MEKKKGININGDWRSVIFSIFFVIIFVITPISLNETIGFDNILASLQAPEQQINPYYGGTTGEVAGVSIVKNRTTNQFTSTQQPKASLTKQNLLIIFVILISAITFSILYIVLTLIEERTKKKDILPATVISH